MSSQTFSNTTSTTPPTPVRRAPFSLNKSTIAHQLSQNQQFNQPLTIQQQYSQFIATPSHHLNSDFMNWSPSPHPIESSPLKSIDPNVTFHKLNQVISNVKAKTTVSTPYSPFISSQSSTASYQTTFGRQRSSLSVTSRSDIQTPISMKKQTQESPQTSVTTLSDSVVQTRSNIISLDSNNYSSLTSSPSLSINSSSKKTTISDMSSIQMEVKVVRRNVFNTNKCDSTPMLESTSSTKEKSEMSQLVQTMSPLSLSGGLLSNNQSSPKIIGQKRPIDVMNDGLSISSNDPFNASLERHTQSLPRRLQTIKSAMIRQPLMITSQSTRLNAANHDDSSSGKIHRNPSFINFFNQGSSPIGSINGTRPLTNRQSGRSVFIPSSSRLTNPCSGGSSLNNTFSSCSPVLTPAQALKNSPFLLSTSPKCQPDWTEFDQKIKESPAKSFFTCPYTNKALPDTPTPLKKRRWEHSFQDQTIIAYEGCPTSNYHNIAETNSLPTIRCSDFTTLDSINSGSFGHIFKVRHNVNQEIYALKKYKKPFASLQQRAKRLSKLSNLKSLYNLNGHKNIIRLYAVWQEDNRLHVLMEFCDSKDLRQYIYNQSSILKRASLNQDVDKNQSIASNMAGSIHKIPNGDLHTLYDEQEAWRLINQLASALSCLHSDHNLLHCDVSTSNIYLHRHKRTHIYKLGDLDGICKMKNFNDRQKELDGVLNNLDILSTITAANSFEDGDLSEEISFSDVEGQCQAPELLNHRSSNPAHCIKPSIDIFALGVVLYTFVTGQKVTKLNDNTVRLDFGHSILPEPISAALQNLISKMTSFKASDRPSIDQILQIAEHQSFLTTKERNKVKINDAVVITNS